MKILVYATFALNTPHFETELEIIQNHLDAGDEVSIVGCNAALQCCDINWNHNLSICIRCIGRRKGGIKRLTAKIKRLPQIKLKTEHKEELSKITSTPETITELKENKIENFDIGYGVLSSLVSWKRDPEVDLSENNSIVLALYKSALATYRTTQSYLDQNAYDRVYVYNGRYALMRAVLRACQSRNIDCYTHEKASTLDRYALWKNTTVHDLKNTAKNIEEQWLTGKNEGAKDTLANQFFIDRVKGISRTWIAFCADHEKDLLPENWDESKKNISIFISSEDEFVAIGDNWKHPIYKNQSEGIKKISQSTIHDKEIHYYLRVHPNLKNIDNSQTRLIETLDAENLTVIPADSRISTYALLKNSSKVITFGSTVGIEATYWDKVSILAGQSFYKYLGATYNPKTHDEVIKLIRTDLQPKDRIAALKYGYYWQTFGIDFKYYQARGIYDGEFRGKKIVPAFPCRLWARILNSKAGRAFCQILQKNSPYLTL